MNQMNREALQSIKPQLCFARAIVLRLIGLDWLAYFEALHRDLSTFATFFWKL